MRGCPGVSKNIYRIHGIYGDIRVFRSMIRWLVVLVIVTNERGNSNFCIVHMLLLVVSPHAQGAGVPTAN
jgi:hypothetical protein